MAASEDGGGVGRDDGRAAGRGRSSRSSHPTPRTVVKGRLRATMQTRKPSARKPGSPTLLTKRKREFCFSYRFKENYCFSLNYYEFISYLRYWLNLLLTLLYFFFNLSNGRPEMEKLSLLQASQLNHTASPMSFLLRD